EVGAGPLDADIERVQAVRDGLGPDGVLRCDAKGRWDPDTAVAAIAALDRAAGGLEFVAQPCPTLDNMAAVRRRVEVRLAAGESTRCCGCSSVDELQLRGLVAAVDVLDGDPHPLQ
ncbi:hypothetical protein H7H51_02975, partial [Mycolicibacterium farcinogenes]|nr:hypothetical protein [Mycolicibacterium farcinogenes]